MASSIFVIPGIGSFSPGSGIIFPDPITAPSIITDSIIFDRTNQDTRIRRTATKTLTFDDNAGGALTAAIFTGPIRWADGTLALPGLAPASDPNSGFYWASDGNILISLNATLNFSFDGSSTFDLRQNAGSIRFGSSQDLILSRPSAGLLNNNGIYRSSQSSLGVTSTDGLVLQNTTAAAAGAQQISPRIRFDTFGWKTDAIAASQAVSLIQELLPVQGAAAPTFNFLWKGSINGVAYSTLATLSSAGEFTTIGSINSGNVITLPAGEAINWVSRGYMSRSADGIIQITNQAQSAGNRIDLTTDGRFQLLTRGGADSAVMAASAYRVGSTAGASFSGVPLNITVVNGIVTAAS